MALGMLVSAPCLLPGQWVAFNDHGSATNTHPRTTRYHMFSLEDGSSGPLRDIVTGAALPVHLTLERSGFMAADAVGVNPAEGTPLARTFEGFVDFTSTNENLGTRFSGTVTFTLSGLTPGQAYRIQGGTVRGGEALTNRWTLMELLGAEAFEHRHSAGILTSNQVAAILANQAAANFGANHTPDTGDMMDWIVLDAGQDGEVRLVFRAYTGTVPGGSSSGATGYVPTALKVREETEQDAITLVDAPLPVNVIEGQPAAFSVLALGDPLSYQWFRDGLPIDGATQRVHRIAATVAADDGAFFSVQVSNHTGVVTAGPR